MPQVARKEMRRTGMLFLPKTPEISAERITDAQELDEFWKYGKCRGILIGFYFPNDFAWLVMFLLGLFKEMPLCRNQQID